MQIFTRLLQAATAVCNLQCVKRFQERTPGHCDLDRVRLVLSADVHLCSLTQVWLRMAAQGVGGGDNGDLFLFRLLAQTSGMRACA